MSNDARSERTNVPEGWFETRVLVREGFGPSWRKLVRDSDMLAEAVAGDASAIPDSSDKTRDWSEDFAGENGNYSCTCHACGNVFRGHKRRVTCKVCAEPLRVTNTQSETPEAGRSSLAGALADGTALGSTATQIRGAPTLAAEIQAYRRQYSVSLACNDLLDRAALALSSSSNVDPSAMPWALPVRYDAAKGYIIDANGTYVCPCRSARSDEFNEEIAKALNAYRPGAISANSSAEDRLDAIRYRWLRDTTEARYDGGGWFLDFDIWIPVTEEPNAFDKAIDAAMNKTASDSRVRKEG